MKITYVSKEIKNLNQIKNESIGQGKFNNHIEVYVLPTKDQFKAYVLKSKKLVMNILTDTLSEMKKILKGANPKILKSVTD